MSSIICQNFVQNTWKKELCSNCFKSKDEHTQSDVAAKMAKDMEREPSARINEKQRSIMKTKRSRKRIKCRVNFKSNLTQVIGYGGEDWSEEEEDVVAYEEESNDAEAATEEEVELLRLTKNNTDFNTNLSSRKLQLGRTQIDAEGRKQTLLVQVTPFGGAQEGLNVRPVASKPKAERDEVDGCAQEPAKRVTSFLVKEIGKEEIEKFKEVTEEVNAVSAVKEVKEILAADREKSLLDEINETLEKSKNPIVKKIVQQEIILSKPVVNEVSRVQPTVVKLTRTPVIKEKRSFQSSTSVNLSQGDLSTAPPEPSKDYEDATNSSSVDDSSSHCGSEDSNSTDSSLESGSKVYESQETSPSSIPSRELAGEPDGRAASTSDDATTPRPTLPDTPPPKIPSPMPQVSSEKVKPKIPLKPATILIRKPVTATTCPVVVLSTFNSDKKATTSHSPLVKRDSNASDLAKKRKAPKPPPTEEPSNPAASIYTRKPIPTAHNDCPVVREKEKRERASSCTPKTTGMMPVGVNPEPAPRRMLSASTDSLNTTGSVNGEEKKKRGKFSLKKLLRMGTSSSSSSSGSNKGGEPNEEKPMPKPRLVIVHPLELQAKVEEQEYVNTTSLQEQIKLQNRPPPPPRNYESPDATKLPPKTTQMKLQLQAIMQKTETATERKQPSETVYANIGEVRNAITPNKPQRTASMREVKEHVYDYIGGQRSSSPECDSKCKTGGQVAPSLSNGHGMSRSVSLTYCGSETESEIYSPYSYYGSEFEVAEDESECCYGNGLGSTGRTHKLRYKKGRSIVHKNLEDNYGAVVIANHEALAQVLENIQQTVHVPLPLRALKTTDNLRWSDFQLRIMSSRSSSPSPSATSSPPATCSFSSITIGNCSFHQAMWNLQNVTLMITVVPQSPSCSLGTFSLQPITEFSDLVPAAAAYCSKKGSQPVQANISVLPPLAVNSIASLSDQLKMSKGEDMHKSSALVLLQLVNGLKALQAQGVEELPLSLSSFVLGKEIERQEAHSRLFILQPNDELQQHSQARGTLCSIVNRALKILPVDGILQRLMQSLLATERAVSLSQAKSVLEFSLWGPSDVALGATPQEREFVLQRWLDLQRATVLHGLVCAKVQLTVYEECHLLFLVRSNAKMMCDASLLLESARC